MSRSARWVSPALVIYGLAWLGVSMMLPHATQDPGALLRGSLLVALIITAMHAASELYLPDRLSRASQLYGAIGTTIVTLGWFFILGRGIVLAMELNAVIYERYGSISKVVFSLQFFPGPGPQVRARAQILRTPVNHVADRVRQGPEEGALLAVSTARARPGSRRGRGKPSSVFRHRNLET